MPSAACTISTHHHTFRGSYSFDDHIADPEVPSRSTPVFTSHPRMLKRQPAIELPLGAEYSSEEPGPSSKDPITKPSDEPEPKESDLTKKTKKGLKTKGVNYECTICGARYKKRDNYEAHKKYYCSELQITKAHPAGAHEVEKTQAEPEPWSQMMHYKLGATLELTPLRKRRKEKSLGDEEEPPGFSSPGPSDAAHNLPLESTKSPAEASKSVPTLEGPTSFQPRTPKPGSGSEPGKERRTMSKEISVIQHTSSFEKSDPPEQPGSLEEDKPLAPFSSPPPAPHGRSAHSLQPRLVRQPNIQVPEILVTEEPDRPDTEPEPPPKEPEKTEEFQWPQRSQTLAQLPAEKLPPKKKRLRLAEMAQSSGESSFESSVPLSRSPSQESSISLSGSSRSASFDREDHGKAETPGPLSDTRSKTLGTHMLTVPSHHPHAREMRRSASEQSPNVPHSSHMTETRSKSFDYGSLSPTGPSVAVPAAPPPPAAPPERRKCFLVRQASLSRPPEAELEATPKGKQESSEEPSASKPSTKSSMAQISVATIQGGLSGSKSQMQDRPPLGSSPPYTEALQVFQPLGTQLPPPVSLFSLQQLLPQEQEQSSEFFPTQAMAGLLSSPYSVPPLPPSLFQAPPLPLQPTVLHPSQLHLPQLLPHAADIPFQQPPSFLPMPCPAPSTLSGYFLPLQSQFALQLPGEIESHLPSIKTSLPPLATGPPGPSSSTEYSSDIQLPPVTPQATSPAPTSASPLALPACPDAMVSLVVPVRIQTHMPSYGSAMYTTLSQILVTQSPGSSTSMALTKYEEPSSKSMTVCGADVYEAEPGPSSISKEQSRGFQTPYLRVPERKGTALSSEGILSLEGCSSTASGSKRVLSPAGSLELTMETQQQKRVKEEEASKADEKLELVSTCNVVLTSTEDRKKTEKPHVGSQGRSRRETETLSCLSSDVSDPKELSPLSQSTLSHGTAPGSEALKEYAQPSSKAHRRCLPPLSVKKEDPKEQTDLPPLAPPSSLPLSDTSPRPAKLQEGTDSKKVLQFPSLHTTTNVSWCYLNYIKPNHIQHADRRSSVYAGWCISLYNPNLPGVSTKAALSLLRSKQKVSKETYTMATAPHPEAGRLVPSNSRKPRMTEVHLPSMVSLESQKDPARVEKEEKAEEGTPTSKRGEPTRVKIFEGGYKSNEEYIYVRGRGRGKYVCEECGIRCKKPSMLKKHIRTHTDVRPYVCRHCHFAFKTKGNLTKHMKSKAHSKKCQETGVLEELEAEEGTSDDLLQDSEGREGSEAVEEHQFSDLEDSDSDSDLDEDEEEEEEEEEESQDELSRPSSEAAPLCLPATLQEDSSLIRGPQPPDATSDAAPRGSSISEATRLTASSCSTPSQGTQGLPRLGLAPLEKGTSSALSPKATSPRRPWSPSKEAGSRPSLTRKHSLTKTDSSPQRCSPARAQASVASTPGPQTGPGRDLSPHLCGSPRPELSCLTPYPIGREVPAGLESATVTGTPRCSPTRRRSLGRAESSPPHTVLPGTWALGGPCSPSVDKYGLGLGPVPRALLQPVPLPHTLLSRSPETCASAWKTESRSPSAGPAPLSSRPSSAPHDFHGHLPSRSEENLFSHLPLHSQHLNRTPCPLIPIGGIQMVQARPGAHPTLLSGPCAAWVSGFSGGGSDLTGAREAQERSRWSPTESPSASVSPVAKVSKFTLSSELEEERTSRGPGRPPAWEPHRAEAPAETMGTHSPCPPQLPQGHPLAPSWRGLLESPHALANLKASSFPPLDRSSSMDCLAETSTCFPPRSRNLSGEPRTRPDSPELLGRGELRTPLFLSKDSGPPSI